MGGQRGRGKEREQRLFDPLFGAQCVTALREHFQDS